MATDTSRVQIVVSIEATQLPVRWGEGAVKGRGTEEESGRESERAIFLRELPAWRSLNGGSKAHRCCEESLWVQYSAHSGILEALRPTWSPDVIKADKGKK